MGNTPKRPSTARKHTRTTEAKRTSKLDQGIRITYDGHVYEVRTGELNALDENALRRETGMTFDTLLSEARDNPGIDIIAMLIWLARRTNGEQMLRFATVAKDITRDSVEELFELEDGDQGEEPPGESQPGDD